MSKIVLVIGATGFLGKHLMGVDWGKYEVYGTTRSKSLLNERLIEFDGLERFLVKNKGFVTAIVNCAVLYSGQADSMNQSNVELPKSLLRLGQKYSIPQLILFDSFYSFAEERYSHLSTYTETKVRLRNEILVADLEDVTVNWIVLGHVFGEDDSMSKFVPSMLLDLLNNRELETTKGEQLRDFTYVGDVVSSIERLIQRKLSEGLSLMYLGSGIERSIKNFIEICVDYIPSESKVNFGSLDYRDNEIMKPFKGNAKIPPMKYQEKFGFDEGLRRTIEYYRDVKRTN